MSGSSTSGLPLHSLIRKAAVDAGFDLEPERDGWWWRLRSSGAPGIAWVRSQPGSDETVPPPADSTLLALPLATQLADTGQLTAPITMLPAGAAGAVSCPSPEALHVALHRVWTMRVHAPAQLRARFEREVSRALAERGMVTEAAPATTEAIAEVCRRVGQDLFREALIDWWEGRCAVTGLAVPELLRASHVKPWAVATDAERLDVHNGLLLAPHLDALFDRGFLSFDDEGRALASGRLAPEDWTALGVAAASLRLRHVHASHARYLAYHREHVFRS